MKKGHHFIPTNGVKLTACCDYNKITLIPKNYCCFHPFFFILRLDILFVRCIIIVL